MPLLDIILPPKNIAESQSTFRAARRPGDAMLGTFVFRPRCSVRELRRFVCVLGEDISIGMKVCEDVYSRFKLIDR